jgi:hypothetical protein
MYQEDEEEMAQVFGSAGKSAFSMSDTRYQDLLSRIALPMLSLLLLIPVGYYLLTRGHFFWGIGVGVFYFVSIKSLEQAGIKLKQRIFHADRGAKAEQDVAEALDSLPDDYYIFHDLEFPGFNIDHVVLGPNGIFLVETNRVRVYRHAGSRKIRHLGTVAIRHDLGSDTALTLEDTEEKDFFGLHQDLGAL